MFFGLAVAALTGAAIATAKGVLALHLLLYIGAGAAWIGAVRFARPARWMVLAIAIAARLPAWLSPPAHSDDVHRYLWDGRVQRAGINPYRYAPDDDALAPLRDDNWARVNNRPLPTIYPPLAQLLFRLAPPWKPLVAAADLGLVLLLVFWLDPRRAIVWAWCPLAVIELSQEGHVDAFGILLMMAAFATLNRRGWAGALLGAAASVKLVALGVVPGLRSGRAAAAFAAVVILAALPYAGAGTRITGSLGEYGRRWRGNDGAFAVIYALSEEAVAHTQYRGRYEEKNGRWPRLVTGRDRDTIFPDEMANFAARVVAGLLLLAAALYAFVKKLPPVRFAEVVLGGWLLLTPTLHPWYVLWVVPLVAAGGNPAWLVLGALAPLGYEPLQRWRESGIWHDPVWTRLVEHGLTWSVLLVGLIPAKRPLLSCDR